MKHLIAILTCQLLLSCTQPAADDKQKTINLDAIALNDKAVELMATSDSANTLKAVELLDKALQMKPDYQTALWNKYVCYETLNHPHNALQTLDEMQRLFPNSPEIKMARGIFLINAGENIRGNKRFIEASRIYNSILDTLSQDNKQYDGILLSKAVNLIFLGREKEGKALIQELYEKEHDEAVRETYALYLDFTRQELIQQQAGAPSLPPHPVSE